MDATHWLNLNSLSDKTTRMTTNSGGLHKPGMSVPRHVVIVTMVFPARKALDRACVAANQNGHETRFYFDYLSAYRDIITMRQVSALTSRAESSALSAGTCMELFALSLLIYS